MERRKFVVGLGALAAGSGAAVGTGAFSSASTGDRTVEVEVTGDANAYLALEPVSKGEQGGNGHFARINEDGELELVLDGSNDLGSEDRLPDFQQGSGVNPDSTYKFDNVFRIGNQGPNTGGGLGEIDVWIESNTAANVDFYWSEVSAPREYGDDAEDGSAPSSMSPGEGHKVGFEVDASGLTDDDTISGAISIRAENSDHTAND